MDTNCAGVDVCHAPGRPGEGCGPIDDSSSGMFGNRTTGSGISAGTSSAFGSNSPLSSLGQSGGQGTPTMNNPNGVGGQARTCQQLRRRQYGSGGPAELRRRGPSQPYRRPQSGAWAVTAWAAWNGRHGHGWHGHGQFRRTALGQGGFGAGMNGNTTTPTPPMRTTLTLGFEPAVGPPPAQVSSAIAEHLMALPALHWQAPAQVEMQGRTAILRGVVATEHDRDLAERVVRLEATVDQVQNQIVVAGPATPKQASPAEHTPAADNSAADNSAAGSSAA